MTRFPVAVVVGLWLANAHLAVAEQSIPRVTSAPCDIELASKKQQTLVRKQARGDLLALGEDGNPAVLKEAQVLLVCRGSRADKVESEWTEECQSALLICTAEGKTLLTNEVPGIKNYKADGGEQTERLALELFRLPVEGAALVLVAHTSAEDCCGSVAKSTEHSLYMVYRNGIRKILSYNAASKLTGEETTDSRAKLQPGINRSRGLTELILQTTKTSSDAKRRRSIRTFIWTGAYYDGCGQGCGPGQKCCNGNCAPNGDRGGMRCREDEEPAPKTPPASSAP